MILRFWPTSRLTRYTAQNARALRARILTDAWGSWKIDVHGGSSQELTGEIGLSEIRIVFAEVSICPETVELLQKSLRETHLEATATCFEFPWQIGWKSRAPQFGIIWLRLVLSWQTPFNQRQAGAGLF